jgi:hypothetical protein
VFFYTTLQPQRSSLDAALSTTIRLFLSEENTLLLGCLKQSAYFITNAYFKILPSSSVETKQNTFHHLPPLLVVKNTTAFSMVSMKKLPYRPSPFLSGPFFLTLSSTATCAMPLMYYPTFFSIALQSSVVILSIQSSFFISS